MEHVNDDCLCLILEQLTLSEQITMTHVSARFRELLCNIVWQQPRYRDMTTSDTMLAPLSKEDYLRFFKLISPSMQRFYIGNVHRKAFDSYLGRHLLRPELAYYLRLDFCNLLELTCMDENMNNSMIRTISIHCPQLRSFSVSSSYITGKYIVALSELETLVARNCSIEAVHIKEILSQLKLVFLDLTHNAFNIEQVILQSPGAKHLQLLGLSDASYFGLHLAEQLPQLSCLLVSYKNISYLEKQNMLEAVKSYVQANSVSSEFRKGLSTVCSNCMMTEMNLQQLCGFGQACVENMTDLNQLFRIVYKSK